MDNSVSHDISHDISHDFSHDASYIFVMKILVLKFLDTLGVLYIFKDGQQLNYKQEGQNLSDHWVVQIDWQALENQNNDLFLVKNPKFITGAKIEIHLGKILYYYMFHGKWILILILLPMTKYDFTYAVIQDNQGKEWRISTDYGY